MQKANFEVFSNPAGMVLLADRLMHRAEVITVDVESYRLTVVSERNVARYQQRDAKKAVRKRAGAGAGIAIRPGANALCHSASLRTGRRSRRSPSSSCWARCANRPTLIICI
ncbi:MAG: hypothetical protein V4508_15945 [Pseudomonadota bacterium]